jgi:hypothetical protein
MIAMTTSSSISVKPFREARWKLSNIFSYYKIPWRVKSQATSGPSGERGVTESAR